MIDISSYHHWNCEFESRSWRGVLDTTYCHNVCQWPAADPRFSLDALVSYINKSDRHDMTDILLKVALNTIILTRPIYNIDYIILACLLFWLFYSTFCLRYFHTWTSVLVRYFFMTSRPGRCYFTKFNLNNIYLENNQNEVSNGVHLVFTCNPFNFLI